MQANATYIFLCSVLCGDYFVKVYGSSNLWISNYSIAVIGIILQLCCSDSNSPLLLSSSLALMAHWQQLTALVYASAEFGYHCQRKGHHSVIGKLYRTSSDEWRVLDVGGRRS